MPAHQCLMPLWSQRFKNQLHLMVWACQCSMLLMPLRKPKGQEMALITAPSVEMSSLILDSLDVPSTPKLQPPIQNFTPSCIAWCASKT